MRPAVAPPMNNRADRGIGGESGGGYKGYGIALSPMQNDLLALGVKADGEEGYNMHNAPLVDGESVSLGWDTHPRPQAQGYDTASGHIISLIPRPGVE